MPLSPLYIEIESQALGNFHSTNMAQTSTSFFTVVIPTLVWLKFQSFLEGIHGNNNISEEPNRQSPKSPTSTEQPLVSLMEYRLDIEALSNDHGTNTLPPSPEMTISETPETSIITCTVQDSSSRWLRLRLRPNFVTTSITQQHTESDSTPQRAATATATATGTAQQEPSNPIAQIFQDQELGKVIIGFLVPMTAAFLNPYAPIPPLMRKLILLPLSLGLVALWNGILLRQTIPGHAMAIEQLGAAFVLLAFYALISSFLPVSLVWLPLICFALVVFPFFLSYYLRKTKDLTSE